MEGVSKCLFIHLAERCHLSSACIDKGWALHDKMLPRLNFFFAEGTSSSVMLIKGGSITL